MRALPAWRGRRARRCSSRRPTRQEGLDFANVSHVYAIGLASVPSAAEYTHIAGRTGRVGQAGDGVVTSIVAEAGEVRTLKQVVEGALGRTLLLAEGDAAEVGVEEEAMATFAVEALDELDDVRRGLDDTLRL